MRRRREVVVYSRANCGLCAVAEQHAAREARRHHLRVIDVDEDDDLQRAYNVRVPVVLVDGVIVAEGRVERGQIRRALRSR